MSGAWKSFLLLCSLAGALSSCNSEREPGQSKQDYDTKEEVRGHDKEIHTETPAEDAFLMREAILDVAYYLRRFKFSGYDPRYLAEGEIPRQNLFQEFPSPPLRNIHWEVKKNCEPSFVECVKYLQEQLSQTVLPRRLDSLTITKRNRWSFIKDRNLIKSADDECLRLLHNDQHTFATFSGPAQRFQWLVSASYYMCFYTMKEISLLRNFSEDCDNYASCIQWDSGLNNKDVRGDNNQPFACASYSFCPDPCCPLKHLPNWAACRDASPCIDEYSTDRTCSFSRSDNSDFESLTLNQWNISCKCNRLGTRWDSKSGLCVDIDECVEVKSPCHFPVETCRNVPGSHKCGCSALGYSKNPISKTCERDPILYPLFFESRLFMSRKTKSFSERLSSKFRSFIRKIKSALTIPFSDRGAEPNQTEGF